MIMKQEYEDLLLKDLCARLSYGVKVLADINKTFDGGIISEVVCINLRKERVELDDVITPFHYDEVKPYLRPMSSMTEEEKQELLKVTSLIEYDEDCETLMSFDFYGDARLDVGMEIWMKAFDWLNKKMFAYRTYNDKDMFELGLAIPAPAGMYE